MRAILVTTFLSFIFISGCTHEPTPIAPPVENFDVQKYGGTWYEIMRMPHAFEEGLQRVTAEYRLNGDGTLEVTNRGYHVEQQEWQTAIGHAEPLKAGTGMYKVSFFWPFYGGYYVTWLGDNYRYAMVTSDSPEYFWLLARSPQVPQDIVDLAMAQANDWGIDSSQLLMVEQPAAN